MPVLFKTMLFDLRASENAGFFVLGVSEKHQFHLHGGLLFLMLE